MTTIYDILNPVPDNFQPQAIIQMDDKDAKDSLNWILAAASIAIFEECDNILIVDTTGNGLGVALPSNLEELIAKQISTPETRGKELPAMGPLSTIHPLVYICPQNRNHPMYFFQSRPLRSPICSKDGVDYILWQSS